MQHGALRIDPGHNVDKVGHKAGHAAGQQGVVARDDLLRRPVGVILLGDD